MNSIFCFCFPHIHNRPSPSLLDFHQTENLRTIIVIADIHQGLYKSPCTLASTQRPYLTFWHWSSVTPYTSSYEFAGSCVFGKQSPGRLSLRPQNKLGQALFRRYGRFFAEFLGAHSLVRLTLLELHTCVGLRYGRTYS